MTLKNIIKSSASFNSSLVSVVMNCHNGEKFLNEAILSVLDQTYKNFELVFFNNHSSDNSENIVKSFNDERIKYYSSKQYLNLYGARNEAIKKAKGEYIAFIDTDDLWVSNKIEKQLEFFEKNLDTQILYTNYYIFKNSKKDKRLFLKKKKPSGKITQDLLNSNSIGINTIMIKKKVFENYNFKSNYSIIGDFDFLIKFSFKNNIEYLDLPLAYYRWHGENLSNRRIDIYLKEFTEWLKLYKQPLSSQGFSLFYLRLFLLKLRVKLFFKNFF